MWINEWTFLAYLPISSNPFFRHSFSLLRAFQFEIIPHTLCLHSDSVIFANYHISSSMSICVWSAHYAKIQSEWVCNIETHMITTNKSYVKNMDIWNDYGRVAILIELNWMGNEIDVKNEKGNCGLCESVLNLVESSLMYSIHWIWIYNSSLSITFIKFAANCLHQPISFKIY